MSSATSASSRSTLALCSSVAASSDVQAQVVGADLHMRPCARSRASGSGGSSLLDHHELRSLRDMVQERGDAHPGSSGRSRNAGRRARGRPGPPCRPAPRRPEGYRSTTPTGRASRAPRTPTARRARHGPAPPPHSAAGPRGRCRARRAQTVAKDRSSRCARWAKSVVLPKPAGATTLTARASDAQSRSITCRLRHRLRAQRRRRELRFDHVERELSRGHGYDRVVSESRRGAHHPLGVNGRWGARGRQPRARRRRHSRAPARASGRQRRHAALQSGRSRPRACPRSHQPWPRQPVARSTASW